MNGSTGVQKIWRRIVVFTVIFGVFGFIVGCSISPSSTLLTTTAQKDTTAPTKPAPTTTPAITVASTKPTPAPISTKIVSKPLQIGDSATIDKVTVSVNKAYLTKDRNQFEEKKPTNVVIVEYTMKNGKDTDVTYGLDFELYANGKKMDKYPISDASFGSISAGRAVDCRVGFGYNEGPLELEFKPLLSFSGQKATFVIVPTP